MTHSQHIKQSNVSTMMDKATLRRLIGEMFRELRDNAINGLGDKARYLKWNSKPGSNNEEDSFNLTQMVTDYGVNGGLPEDKWDDSVLEKLYRGLADSRVEVEILREDSASSKHSSLAPNGKNPRVHDILRDRLLQTIEKATGRPIISSRSSKIADPRRSDPRPPNSYRWQFSKQYPSFPTTKGGISRWPAEHIRQCHEALDKGFLVAVDLATNPAKDKPSTSHQNNFNKRGDTDERQHGQDEHLDERIEIGEEEEEAEHDQQHERDESNEIIQESDEALPESDLDDDTLPCPPNNTAESTNHVNVDPGLLLSRNPFKEELEDFDVESTNTFGLKRFLVDFHHRMYEDTLHMALKKYAEELKWKWKVGYTAKKQELRSEIDSLNARLETKILEVEEAQREIARLDSERASLVEQLSKTDDESTIKLDKAREAGEELGRRKAMDDVNTAMESDLLALRRSNLEQISKVRAESYKEGFEAGRKAALQTTSTENAALHKLPRTSDDSRPTSPALNQSNRNSVDIQALMKEFEEERISTLELGRRQGRETAYQELALSEGNRVNVLVKNDSGLNKNRKRTQNHSTELGRHPSDRASCLHAP
ncbi:uncharacterized protein LY89DRAFT_501279 [Mollisia scopiformis]|uniref:Uncharacterized protein n=1 Tax=Mollisia scopiformis TaxID=149040 RepID=A0A194XEQ7_MOLSC|nr:uncharacterized protein LY89DRAFT_501279 [Mollisia scopiformis]KUJ18658.1 hypothetical protein LY89DRAFT_501279 [Mollisia scopiformis]